MTGRKQAIDSNFIVIFTGKRCPPFYLLFYIVLKCLKHMLINLHPVGPADIWSEQSFQTDPDLPPGWKKITDMAGIYYWHIPTGTTQWERPALHTAASDPQTLGDVSSTPRKHSLGSLSCSPTPDHEVSARKMEK